MFAIKFPPTVLFKESRSCFEGHKGSPGTKRHPPAKGEIGLTTVATCANGLLAAKEERASKAKSVSSLQLEHDMIAVQIGEGI